MCWHAPEPKVIESVKGDGFIGFIAEWSVFEDGPVLFVPFVVRLRPVFDFATKRKIRNVCFTDVINEKLLEHLNGVFLSGMIYAKEFEDCVALVCVKNLNLEERE